jgi:2-iminobutanoate/2-iminopropanoate deaminase
MPTAIQVRRTAITSPELTPPVGPFSQATEAGGFITSAVRSVKTRRRASSWREVLRPRPSASSGIYRRSWEAAGRSFDDVVRAGVYLANMNDFVAMNGIYAKHFSQPFPARTTIAVTALPLGARVEIDLVVKA